MRLLTVVGARPQFVKAAVFSRAALRHNGSSPEVILDEQILHTGQHYDPMLSQSFFDEMDIPQPVVNLNVGSGNHGEVTGMMLREIEREILARRPNWVLVYGDTNSTLAGALAAVKLHVPVVHVEAGLRSFNRRMPEEINRVVTDHVSDALFCPSQHSQAQLAREGITRNVFVEGDLMYDAVLHYRPKALYPSREGAFALATLHRAENADDPRRLSAILEAMADSPIPVLMPLHPRTRLQIQRQGLEVKGQLHLLQPASYFEMLGYLERCSFVITDSGGLQKEAYFFGKRCITVRDETEWVELVQCGANRVVGADGEAIREAIAWAMEPASFPRAIYGEGDAGQRMVRRLLELTAYGTPQD